MSQNVVNLPPPNAIDLRSNPARGGGAMVPGFRDNTYGPPPPFHGAFPGMGNVFAVPCIVGVGSQVFLARPTGVRIFLAVLNNDLNNGNVFLSWDTPASTAATGASWPFGPTSSFNFQDFVPQNEINLIASAANTTFLIWYCDIGAP